MEKNNLKGSLILVTAALIWGLAFVAQSDASRLVPPFMINCLRSLISVAFLFLLLKFKNRKSHIPLFPNDKTERKGVLTGSLICGIMLTVSVNFQQFGIAFYPKGAAVEAHSGFITAMYVVIVPLISVFTGKKIRPIIWGAVALCIMGFYLLCFTNGLDSVYLGDILVFVCAVSFSLHIISVDRFVDQIGGIRLSMLQFAVCGLLSGILSLIFELSKLSISNIIAAAPQILYLGIMSSGIAYTLQIIGQRYAEPAVASLSMSLESVFAALGGYFAYVWLNIGSPRSLSAPEIIGCVLVFAATVISQLPPIKLRKKVTANG